MLLCNPSILSRTYKYELLSAIWVASRNGHLDCILNTILLRCSSWRNAIVSKQVVQPGTTFTDSFQHWSMCIHAKGPKEREEKKREKKKKKVEPFCPSLTIAAHSENTVQFDWTVAILFMFRRWRMSHMVCYNLLYVCLSLTSFESLHTWRQDFIWWKEGVNEDEIYTF